MSDIRAQFNLELDEDFQIRDYPTLGHVANYVAGSTDSPAKSGESREPQEEEKSTRADIQTCGCHRGDGRYRNPPAPTIGIGHKRPTWTLRVVGCTNNQNGGRSADHRGG